MNLDLHLDLDKVMITLGLNQRGSTSKDYDNITKAERGDRLSSGRRYLEGCEEAQGKGGEFHV